MYCSRLFVVVFQEINCLHTFKHAHVRRVTELHLSTKFMFVSAVVSEICESKEKEKEKNNNSEIDYFQFNTFPGHII